MSLFIYLFILTLETVLWLTFSSPTMTYLVPETGVVEPLQKLLSHDHRAGEEGPVCQQEVLDIGGVHHRVLLH